MNNTLNIISDSVGWKTYGGPGKVLVNTIKGLEKLNYPYVLNKDPGNFRLNWVHDSVRGLIEVARLKIPAIVGPNIAVLPSNLPAFRPSLSNCVYLHPSQWCVDLWRVLNFNECPLLPWPAGIDSELFKVNRGVECEKNVMIYFKRRDHALLDIAIAEAERLGYKSLLLKYGDYNEDQFRNVLSNSIFGIWIGISESQGIGLQEALSSGLPLIVCDVNSLFESSDKKDYSFPETLKKFKPTSAPYFDKRCGIIINDISELGSAISYISANLAGFNPEQYIKENLSLEKQAEELLSFFDILKQQDPEYFQLPKNESESIPFRVSLHGKMIYFLFLLRRKARTLHKMIRY